ncbi:TetR/AcrR family transcriptional regulator [Nocardia camponoti]|uniref:HTH tetR-type domain-containing protein n=1 Tax=Nocardia camponoti TaxID=1616106 RepID=A0A917QGK9_9NOCA|nr:TetR/AcrR family transcriptional regulator [Nocardia camponoti]GGK49556.1 hypothetical protein GCM10011591_21220 [Nocardia camponoti]
MPEGTKSDAKKSGAAARTGVGKADAGQSGGKGAVGAKAGAGRAAATKSGAAKSAAADSSAKQSGAAAGQTSAAKSGAGKGGGGEAGDSKSGAPGADGKAGAKRGVTAEQIVEAGLALIDRGEKLSIRAVAEKLGISPSTVYARFPTRHHLEQAIVEYVLKPVPLGPLTDPGVEWTAAVIQFALALRDQLLAHPRVMMYMISGPLQGPVATTISEAMFTALARGGLRRQARAHGVYAVLVQVVGDVLLEAGETDGVPPLPPESDLVKKRRSRLAGIDRKRYPRTAAHVDEIAEWVSVDQFVWALRALLVGMTAG